MSTVHKILNMFLRSIVSKAVIHLSAVKCKNPGSGECMTLRFSTAVGSMINKHWNRLSPQNILEYAKCLGTNISDNIDWGQHVSEITCKATKTMGFIRHNLPLEPRHTQEFAQKTLVRFQLEYAAPICHPYHESQIEQMEKVHITAVRRTCRRRRNTRSVSDMLDELEWTSLEARKEQSYLAFFYKIHSGTVSIEKVKYLTRPQT